MKRMRDFVKQRKTSTGSTASANGTSSSSFSTQPPSVSSPIASLNSSSPVINSSSLTHSQTNNSIDSANPPHRAAASPPPPLITSGSAMNNYRATPNRPPSSQYGAPRQTSSPRSPGQGGGGMGMNGYPVSTPATNQPAPPMYYPPQAQPPGYAGYRSQSSDNYMNPAVKDKSQLIVGIDFVGDTRWPTTPALTRSGNYLFRSRLCFCLQ